MLILSLKVPLFLVYSGVILNYLLKPSEFSNTLDRGSTSSKVNHTPFKKDVNKFCDVGGRKGSLKCSWLK